ncbi:hypothetical protein Tco_0154420 [Tanacetum coccineum]
MQESEPPKKIKKREMIQIGHDEELAQKLHAKELAKSIARQEHEKYDFKKDLELQKQLDEREETTSTPVDLEKPLVRHGDANDVDVHLYRSMIGSLMYLTASRPDIMFAVCACARFQVTPKTSHLLAVKRIFRYLKGKPTLGLWYSRDSPFELVVYTHSDYVGATQDRKSTTGGCQFLGNSFDINAVQEAKLLIFLQKVFDADKGSGNISKTQTKATPSRLSSPRTSSEGGQVPLYHGGSPVQARPERLSNLPNKPPLGEGNTSRSVEGSMQLLELMEICTKLLDKVIALEDELRSTKAVYNKSLITLTKRVKKLENKLKLKRRSTIVNSSEDEEASLDIEDPSKQGRMKEEKIIKIKNLVRYPQNDDDEITLTETLDQNQGFVPKDSEIEKEVIKRSSFIQKQSTKEDKEKKKDEESSKQVEEETVQKEDDKDKRQKKQDDPEKLMEFVKVISDSEEMLNDFDREDLIVSYRLFNEKYASTRPGFDDLMLWGDMKVMFEPNSNDAVWKNHNSQELIEWKLYDSCEVHSLMLGEFLLVLVLLVVVIVVVVMVVVAVFVVVDFVEDVEIIVKVVVVEENNVQFADRGVAGFDEDDEFGCCDIMMSCDHQDYLHERVSDNQQVEFQRISLIGFRSCTSRSHYRSISKQTTQ